MTIISTERRGQVVGTLALYSLGLVFKSQPRDRLSSLRIPRYLQANVDIVSDIRPRQIFSRPF
jgi:hypothetical protein